MKGRNLFRLILVVICVQVFSPLKLSQVSEDSLRRLHVSSYHQNLYSYYDAVWNVTSGLENFSEASLTSASRYFSGDPVEAITDFKGVTLVAVFPADIAIEVGDLQEDIWNALVDRVPGLTKKLYFVPFDALHITIQSIESAHPGELSEDASSHQTLNTVVQLVEGVDPFFITLERIGLTPGGGIIVEGYVDTPSISELRSDIGLNLPFIKKPAHEGDFFHVTIGRFLPSVTEDDFREAFNVISNMRDTDIGGFLVREMLYAYIKTRGLEFRDQGRDCFIQLRRD